MYAQKEKTKENKSRAVASSVARKKRNVKQGFGFVDNRPEAILQSKFQEMVIQNHAQLQQSIIIQRQDITANDAQEALGERGGFFTNDNTNILTPWGDNPVDSNCHGYTLNGATGHSAIPEELMEGIGAEDAVAVFTSGNEIAHSGAYVDAVLTHLLIGVGICQSDIGLDSTAGYDNRYNLPNDRAALDEVLAAVVIEAAAEARRDHVDRILGYAQDYKVVTGERVNYAIYSNIDKGEQDQFIQDHLVEINRIREILNTDHHVGDEEEVQ